jgi:NAD(P)-dependent dehydrogenase (short-subunit alcohol dehydrogenase family)
MTGTPGADAAAPADPFDVGGRVAIVTGGSRGLGKATAAGLAARGAAVVIASRDTTVSAAVVAEIEATGGTALAVAVDTANMADVNRLVDVTIERFGRLDVLVNNAADPTLARAADVDEETYDRVHAINAKGPFFLAQRARPHLAASGHGSIINVLSVGAWNGGPMMLLYRSSKSTLLGITMTLAKEWAADGIRVNAIAPGTFETDMIDWMDDASRARAIGVTPQQRIADPAEIVPAMLYLASDASSFTTGTVLRVDGGMLSW